MDEDVFATLTGSDELGTLIADFVFGRVYARPGLSIATESWPPSRRSPRSEDASPSSTHI